MVLLLILHPEKSVRDKQIVQMRDSIDIILVILVSIMCRLIGYIELGVPVVTDCLLYKCENYNFVNWWYSVVRGFLVLRKYGIKYVSGLF